MARPRKNASAARGASKARTLYGVFGPLAVPLIERAGASRIEAPQVEAFTRTAAFKKLANASGVAILYVTSKDDSRPYYVAECGESFASELFTAERLERFNSALSDFRGDLGATFVFVAASGRGGISPKITAMVAKEILRASRRANPSLRNETRTDDAPFVIEGVHSETRVSNAGVSLLSKLLRDDGVAAATAEASPAKKGGRPAKKSRLKAKVRKALKKAGKRGRPAGKKKAAEAGADLEATTKKRGRPAGSGKKRGRPAGTGKKRGRPAGTGKKRGRPAGSAKKADVAGVEPKRGPGRPPKSVTPEASSPVKRRPGRPPAIPVMPPPEDGVGTN